MGDPKLLFVAGWRSRDIQGTSASMIVKDHWDRIVVLFGDQLMKSMRGIGTLAHVPRHGLTSSTLLLAALTQ